MRNESVHVVVRELSPVKKGRTSMYFDALVTDGSMCIRLVGGSLMLNNCENYGGPVHEKNPGKEIKWN